MTDQLISSVFSSVVKTSLAVQKAAPKKKGIVKKKAASAASAPPNPHVAEAKKASVPPKQDAAEAKKHSAQTPGKDVEEEWISVKSKKGSSGKAAFVVPSQVVSPPSATKSSALTSNAFYLPKKLEKDLNKGPQPKKPKVAKLSTTVVETAKGLLPQKTKVVGLDLPSTTKDAPQLTKSQRKNQLRAQKRAKKRAEKEKAALLLKENNGPQPKEEEEDILHDRATSATAAPNEDGSPVNASDRLLSLPYEVLTNGVMSFLKPEDMSRLGACNRYAKEVSEAGFLWQSLFKQRFPSSKLSPTAMAEWKLAYQLSLTKLVDTLRCWSTQKTFMEDVIGVGVDFTANPKTGSVDYVQLSQDLLSQTAFSENKVRTDAFGNSFQLFLPLYFSAEHFGRALPQIEKTIAKLAHNRKGKFRRFHPFMVLDVFPKIVTTFVVLLSDNGISACRKSYEGLIRIHRLFLALAHQYPEIQKEALRRLQLFVSDEKHRTKAACPNLGSILPLLMILDEKVCAWSHLRLPYVSETFDRSVLWVCKKFPQLERTHDKTTGKVESEKEAESRVELTLQAGQVTLRLMMFHVYFIKALNKEERANRYDRFFGQPEPKEMETATASEDDDIAKPKPSQISSGDATIRFAHFREQINYIMTANSWQRILPFLGLACPKSKAEMAARLRAHVVNSRRKKYHTAGMDFNRVQASGTSRILSKGQEYSASSDLSLVVFRDDWGFEGSTKFLDATCLLYKGKQLLETVDFSNTQGSNGAVRHSGDVMTATTGSHAIHLNLDALDKEVTSCVFVLSAYDGATLADIKSPKVSFSNTETEEVLCTYDLDSVDKVDYLTSVIMCRLYRVSSGAKQGWHVQAIGDAHKGDASNYNPIYEAVKRLL